ncbi:filament-like plant protein 1 [Nicotiana tomentosiformis]|uniref:filament-like plant protein 1 n=1 Tax=Nicotiana tomentosiformis TaxID=4098 RepID=UPI00388CCD42
MKLSKGRWEAGSHGLGKDVAMRPPSGDEEVPAPRQVKDKKRKGAPKVDNGALTIIPEQGKVEAISSRAEMVEGEIGGKASRAEEDISRDELGIVDITGSPQISDAMIREANMLESRSYEGIQGSTDIHGFLDGLESVASEDIIGFGGLPTSMLHHEAFLRIWEEHEAEVRDLTTKSDTYKLLSEKLRADLVTTRDEHAEMAEQAEAKKFKKNMDILASKKEIVQAQLESAEAQLQAVKEKASVQVEKIKELQHRLDLAVFDKASLVDELKVARSEVAVSRSEVAEANKRVDAKVAQFRVDVEVNQAKSKGMVKYPKWHARKEALEGVQAQGFDIMAELKEAKVEKAIARKLAFSKEDSESSSESEDGEDLEDEDVTPDEDQASLGLFVFSFFRPFFGCFKFRPIWPL